MPDKKNLLYIFTFGIILFLLSIKGSDEVEIFDVIYKLQIPPWLILIKHYSNFLLGIMILSLFLLTYNLIGKFEKNISYYYILSIIIYVIRNAIYDNNYFLYMILSIIFYILIYISLGKYLKIDCSIKIIYLIYSLQLASIFTIGLNFYLLMTGGGYVENIPRFFGATAHPNFLGMDCAIYSGILYLSIISLDLKKYIKIIFFIIFVLGFLLIFLSGSRTALTSLLIIMIGSILFNKRTIPIFLIFLIAIFGLIYFNQSNLFLETILRLADNEDTRSEVWAIMLDKFYSNPLFGSGGNIGASENSYLKILACAGLIGIFPFLIYLNGIIRIILNKKKIFFNNYFQFFSLIIISLLICGFFEGYLFEYAGNKVLILIISSAITHKIFKINN